MIDLSNIYTIWISNSRNVGTMLFLNNIYSMKYGGAEIKHHVFSTSVVSTLGKNRLVQQTRRTHSHCKSSRTKPDRIEPDRACSLVHVCFYSPADERFCCASRSDLVLLKCVFFLQWLQILWIAKF